MRFDLPPWKRFPKLIPVSFFLQKLCDHGDNVLRRQRDQQLLPQL